MIIVKTNDAVGLLKQIYAAIRGKNIRTWVFDNEGDFTHDTSTNQWAGRAWLRPKATPVALEFAIIPPQGSRISWETFAVYHGRFIEMLVAHFHDDFNGVNASSGPTGADRT